AAPTPADGALNVLVHSLRVARRSALPHAEEGQRPPWLRRREVTLDSLADDLGHGNAAPARLEAKAGLDVVGKQDSRSLHEISMPHHAADLRLAHFSPSPAQAWSLPAPR